MSTVYSVSMDQSSVPAEGVEMSIRELREQLGKRVDAAYYLGETTIITKNGQPRARIVPVRDAAGGEA